MPGGRENHVQPKTARDRTTYQLGFEMRTSKWKFIGTSLSLNV